MLKPTVRWDYSQYPGYKMFPHLFKPIKLGKLEIPCRIKYASTEDNFNTHEGFITDRDVAYIRERAKGVVGGICTIQGVYMDSKGEGKGYVGQAAIYDDEFIPGLRRLADAIHEEGAFANIQLMHCGRVGGIEIPYCVGPSAIPQRLRIFRPVKEMSKDDIKQCIKEHKEGARRGLEAGFDIIEISGIVGYIISNFLSKYTNRRTDEYGGDVEGRCRFMVETIEAVRDAVGKDVPITIRLCAEEHLDDVGGNTPEECMVTYKMAEKAGVDCISVTQGWQESIVPVITRDVPQGTWLYNAKRAKDAGIKVPLSMAYRLFRPEMANKAIADGIIDVWEMCRPFIADPHLGRKVLEGRLEDIRPCIACNLCLARLFRDAPLACTVNPLVGHEGEPERRIRPAEVRKKVMVVGGGIAGLECARVAALRGHEVHLYEKRDVLGGYIVPTSRAPFGEEELYGLVEHLVLQCKKANVDFHLNTTVTPELIKTVAPNTVVIATGARFAVEKVPGYDMLHVVSAADVLEEKVKVGEKVVVWGGRWSGIVTALYLANKGHKVTLVCRERRVGKDVNPSYLWRYVLKLSQLGVKVYRSSTISKILKSSVVINAPYEVKVQVDVDNVVYAEREPATELIDAAKSLCTEVHVIGDALVPRWIQTSIHEGYRVGVRI